jgi:hypothetical protein
MAPIDAQVVGEELQRIRSLSGKLLPPDVVEESRPRNAPLHPAFEWDDTTAGEKYRVFQARNLIKAVRVVNIETGESAPVFIHIPKANGEQYYQDTTVAVQNVDEFVLAVEGLAKKVTGAQRALDDLRAAAEGRGAEVSALLGIVSQALATARETIARVN